MSLQAASEAENTEQSAPAPSRWSLPDEPEEPASKAKRGKDGHLTLGSSDDFWSNPTGSMKSTKKK